MNQTMYIPTNTVSFRPPRLLVSSSPLLLFSSSPLLLFSSSPHLFLSSPVDLTVRRPGVQTAAAIQRPVLPDVPQVARQLGNTLQRRRQRCRARMGR